jgi:hypothetical protein
LKRGQGRKKRRKRMEYNDCGLTQFKNCVGFVGGIFELSLIRCYVSVKKFKKIAKRGCIYFLNFELKNYAII